MRKAVLLPEVGCPQPTLSIWLAGVGDRVYAGDRLVEILVEGATIDVPSPTTGRLVERRVFNNEPLTPGQVLGTIEEEE